MREQKVCLVAGGWQIDGRAKDEDDDEGTLKQIDKRILHQTQLQPHQGAF